MSGTVSDSESGGVVVLIGFMYRLIPKLGRVDKTYILPKKAVLDTTSGGLQKGVDTTSESGGTFNRLSPLLDRWCSRVSRSSFFLQWESLLRWILLLQANSAAAQVTFSADSESASRDSPEWHWQLETSTCQ